jgi:hypothetical protein
MSVGSKATKIFMQMAEMRLKQRGIRSLQQVMFSMHGFVFTRLPVGLVISTSCGRDRQRTAVIGRGVEARGQGCTGPRPVTPL